MFYENSFLKISQKSPVDTGRKLNVHKTFRRRPGRLLNVLCTFNLRRVSMGSDQSTAIATMKLGSSIIKKFQT